MVIVQNPKIKEIFEKMNYEELSENFNLAKEWFKNLKENVFPQYEVDEEHGTVNVNNPEEVETLIKNVFKSKVTFAPIARANFLVSLAKEIEKNYLTICQIEAKARGILIKDTLKQALSLLAESLRYYSSYAIKSGTENTNLEGVTVHILCDKTFLAFFGLIIGPALAAGHFIILQTAPRISAVTAYILKLAKDIGCPDNVLTLIPGNIDINIFFNHENVKLISAFDNFFQKKYSEISIPMSKNFLAVATSFKTSAIIFSSADLDSACESVVDACWSYQSYLPWSVNQLLVQESVFDTFITKLKERLTKVHVGEPDKKLVDVAYPKDEEVQHNVQKVIFDAKRQELEVYQNDPSLNTFQPTLIIGGRVYGNNVITEDDCSPVVTVVAFRTANEAVALANNSRHGLAASVWTENIELAEEVVRNLKVTNVWINTHGNFSTVTPITFQKMSGSGFFGGAEGFLEYKIEAPLQYNITDNYTAQECDLHNIVMEAKKAQSTWNNFNIFERFSCLQKVALEITKNKNFGGDLQLAEIWATSIYESLTHLSVFPSLMRKYYTLTSVKEPLGTIAIEVKKENEMYVVKTIVAALLQGNSVILLLENVNKSFYEALLKALSIKMPAGVFNLINNFKVEAFKSELKDKELNAIAVSHARDFEGVFMIKDMKKILRISNSWQIVLAQTTVTKNIWCTVQESFS